MAQGGYDAHSPLALLAQDSRDVENHPVGSQQHAVASFNRMTRKLFQLDNCFTILEGTLHCSFWTSFFMHPDILDQHFGLTSLVTEQAFVFHLLDEGSNHTVGHAGWHLLAASWTFLDSASAGSADNVARGAAGHWEVPWDAETHGALQGGLHNLEQLGGSGGSIGHLQNFYLEVLGI